MAHANITLCVGQWTLSIDFSYTTYIHISSYNIDTSIVTTNFSIKTTINWHNDDDQRNRRQIASNLHSRLPAANIQIHMYLCMYVCTLSEYFFPVTHYDDYTINCGRSSKCVCVCV